MLTNNDIKRITDAQIEARKQHFYTKEELGERFFSKIEIDLKFLSLQSKIKEL